MVRHGPASVSAPPASMQARAARLPAALRRKSRLPGSAVVNLCLHGRAWGWLGGRLRSSASTRASRQRRRSDGDAPCSGDPLLAAARRGPDMRRCSRHQQEEVDLVLKSCIVELLLFVFAYTP